MTKIKLGLPLEYKKKPQYFNAWNIGEDTASKNALIEGLLKKHKVETVLDLTCGTGSQVFFLTERGYSCTGADFSPALLEIAREKARQKNLDIRFIEGDMRTIKVGTFDAVITIFNAIGHLSKSGFAKALRNTHRNLKEGGIYVFDILNLEAMTDPVVTDLAYYIHKKIDDTQILSMQCSAINREQGILTSYDSYLIQKNANKPERSHNTFSLQLYTAEELQDILAQNGFETLSQQGMEGAEFSAKTTLNILTVARKRSNKVINRL